MDSPARGRAPTGPDHVLSVTVITRVFGSGQQVTAVAVEYDAVIDGSRLTTTSFRIADRTVTRVSVEGGAGPAAPGREGRVVLVELSPDDEAAPLWVRLPPSDPPRSGPPRLGDTAPRHLIVPASATITQTGVVVTEHGRHYPPDPTTPLVVTRVENLVVDDFEQQSYADPVTGRTLAYHLFTPRDCDPAERYPLVLFMPDADVVAVDPVGPLVQGLGAVAWASPGFQADHPCFVLAPQYPEVVVSDDYEPSTFLDATVHLLEHVASTHPVDRDRLYSTGQSMGGMLTLAVNLRHPGLLAASYVVAGQWPADHVEPLARTRLWVLVSEGDAKAFPMQNAIMAVIESQGTKVARARWTAVTSVDELDVGALTAQHASVNYVHVAAGTLPGTQPGGTGNEHSSTWRIAYDIPGIMSWIMQQTRRPGPPTSEASG